MSEKVDRAVAIVGVGAVLPDAPDAPTFWSNVRDARYSISDVPAGRWDPELYFDPDPSVPDKTYSRIGGWVTDWAWDPMTWRLPIPPKVAESMDRTHIWSIVAAREALADYGHPGRELDGDRTAVILGNAMGGDRHYETAMRVYAAEHVRELEELEVFRQLPPDVQRSIVEELRMAIAERAPDITEDTMPGELANITAGRIANLFNFHGPNFVTDAACASALAGIDAAIEGLEQRDYDAVLTGGIDSNMSASSFVKFCKIGALSATGTRPYGQGADGFVMGEGAAVFLLKRLEDAERDGDHIYAVIRGVGGSSDGRGKGITAPNPVGQRFAVQRAWKNAGSTPDSASLIEGHGTSTRVGDVVEFEALSTVFSSLGLAPGSLPLGSVKSNIGHLKAAAGAAGMLKATMALNDRVLPPSLNASTPNPNLALAGSPLYVNTELREWKASAGQVRQAGVSAFGFGGTNFHVVLEEYLPGRIRTNDRKVTYSLAGSPPSTRDRSEPKAPLRGALVVGGSSDAAIIERLRAIADDARNGMVPPTRAPAAADLEAEHRVAIDFGDAHELVTKVERAIAALETTNDAAWQLLANQGVFKGVGSPGHLAFLYTGQGSQYVNMLDTLRRTEPIVRDTFIEADAVMEPILGKPLTDYIFIDTDDPDAVRASEVDLMQTEITQPAVLTVDLALQRLMAAYGIEPSMVMGHSLGEYGALVAADALPFEDALRAVAGRGREMANVQVDDRGLMAAVFAPIDDIERVVESVDDYVVVANVNSNHQAVIGGSTAGVEAASELLGAAGAQVVPLPVSHAFHTEIVAPASAPLMEMLATMDVRSPSMPIVANTTGDFYPRGPQVDREMIEILGQQIFSPVQFVKGLETLYKAGARVLCEIGPKKALHGMAEDVLGSRGDVRVLFANHPKQGDLVSFNQALCGMYAAGLGTGRVAHDVPHDTPDVEVPQEEAVPSIPPVTEPESSAPASLEATGDGTYAELGHLLADFLDRANAVYRGSTSSATSLPTRGHEARRDPDAPVVITGAGIGLPGMERVFEEGALSRLLHGEQFIDAIPLKSRQEIVDHHITRLVKSKEGGGHFETIDTQADVIKLAGRGGTVSLADEFGFPAEREAALDRTAQLAIGAGIDALRDAGIPLVMSYKTATTGAEIPERWMLPEAMRDDTAVIFASAFPGTESLIDEVTRFNEDKAARDRLVELEELRARADGVLADDLDRRIHELTIELERDGYVFDRRFLYKSLSFAHAQFAEYIGARGPNTQVNAACASTTQAVAIAEDWIREERCARVIIISSDDVTTDAMLGWIGSGFLAVGAAATDEIVEDAAIPFDRRRHGMILGMGAAALVVESPASAADRGILPIAEVLSSVTANSAFHGSRLDPSHIRQVMEGLVATAEHRWGIDRSRIAPETMFVSHETYTPARGGSAQAEVDALRHVFGSMADQIVITNTKGYTGHAMATGVEDVLAIKAMETGIVPKVPNYKEVDPDLGVLNLSTGGSYPVRYGLRLGAGFGSQVSMTLYRAVPSPLGRHPDIDQLGFGYRIVDGERWARWLASVTGHDAPEIEIVARTLRVADQGAPVRAPARPTPAVVPVAPSVAAPASVASMPAATPPPPPAAAAVSAAAPAAAVPVAAVAPGAVGGDPVADRVLEIVAGETGYPSEMLDLDLDLEADLGIDTVKQAEMFAAIRGEWDIERDDAVALRDYPTLRAVIGFVLERRPDLAAAPAAAVPVAAVAPGAVGGDPVADRVLEIVAGETGYPSEMLDLDLDLEADLGIDTVKQAEMFAAIRGEWDIERDDAVALRDYPTLRAVIGFVLERRPDLAAAPAAAVPGAAVAPGAVGGDPVADRVLEIVAGETGYPSEMLDLDLDLEADLGIDTVKQAEMFAAIRGEWDIERDDAVALRDYPTLRAVIGFVLERRPDLAAAPAAAVPVAAVAPGAVGGDPVADRVLEIVAGETGYPSEMLDLDLDLEADLGIDTVKQAEMFAAIRGEWDIERDDAVALRDYPTLRAVIGFVLERRPDLAPGKAPVDAPPAAAETVSASTSVVPMDEHSGGTELERRVPVVLARPPASVSAPTGVELGEGSRVVVAADAGGVGTALADRLVKRGVEVLLVDDAPDAEELVARIDAWRGATPVTGVYWLRALDAHGAIEGMDLDTWREELRVRVKLLFETMRYLYEDVAAAGTFLVSATRLGGRFGFDEHGPVSPMGGAVSGFTKTFKRERPGALVKVVDVPASRKTAAFADILIEETLVDPGAIEIGRTDDGMRWTLGLGVEQLPEHPDGMQLGPESVFVVTGAAGSIVSAITADLAAASGGVFHLMDLVPQPDRDSEDLAAYRSDPDALRLTIFERLKTSGERATPAVVEREMGRLERASAALDAIEAIEGAGGTVHYHSVNLLDGDAMAATMAEIAGMHERVDVLLHAGGLEISRLLPDKDRSEYDLVFDVKADGWFNLIAGLSGTEIGATVAFSSIAGRFGNAGQSDYSAANDLLCKYALSFRGSRPDTIGLAIDWTAWGDIGMATRGSIPTIMKAAGIDMLPAALGVPFIREELTGASGSREMLVAQRLGMLTEEWGETAGVDPAAFTHRLDAAVMADTVISFGVHEGLTTTVDLDPTRQGFLFDHQIDGTPVLPGVMGVEAFAEVASLPWDDLVVTAVEDVEFLAPFKFYKDEPRTVTVTARFAPEGDDLVAHCALLGSRTLPTSPDPVVTVHFTGKVRLRSHRSSLSTPPIPDDAAGVGAGDLYEVYFHGPTYQVLDHVWRRGDLIGGALAADLPTNHDPADRATITNPRLLELCFQTAGAFEIGTTGAMALPMRIGSVTYGEVDGADSAPATAVVSATDDGFTATVVTDAGPILRLDGYRTVRLPGAMDESLVAPVRGAMGGDA